MNELTARQREILAFGWEVMKWQIKHVGGGPQLYLWLAEDGWRGGSEIAAEPFDDKQVAIRCTPWETLILPPMSNAN